MAFDIKSKLVVVIGPTSSGKSALAIKLAKKFGGEIVSADSRQLYKGMDLGTGKVTNKEMEGIPHHLLSIVSPKKRFTVVQYRKKALAAIKKIHKKNKIPFLVGGTGFYIQAVIDGIVIPQVAPDWRLRRELAKKSAGELFFILTKYDPVRARTIGNRNKRQLIRAVEITQKTKRPVPPPAKNPFPADILIIGVEKSKDELKKAIRKRLLARLKRGMIAEVKRLRKFGISRKRLEEFGLEYRFLSRYLQNKISREEMINQLQKAIEDYARRQMVWFSAHGGSASDGKRDKRIHWIRNEKEAKTLASNFLETGHGKPLAD